jgi:glycosyltransferase involved in cell wall biosynthesis
LSLRILHILDSDLDFQSRRIAEDLMRVVGAEVEIEQRIIGRGGNDRGITSAFFRLRGRRDFDLVHTFGRRSLLAAGLSTGMPIIHSPPAESSDADFRWLQAIREYRSIRVVGSTDFEMRRLARVGVMPDGCTLIHPGVDFSRIKPKRNTELRSALGFTDLDYVILPVGESTQLARHELALWSWGILSELNDCYKLLLWGRGPRALRLIERSRPWRSSAMIRSAEPVLGRTVEYEELLSAADLVLVTADNGVATLPIALSMAAGLPIISVVNRTTSELLEDRHTAAMVGTEQPRDLGRRVLDVRGDAKLQWHIADQARAEAYEHFSLSKSMQQWRELYEAMNVGASATLVKPNL